MALYKEIFIQELKEEGVKTRKELLLVPVAFKTWKPHSKSMTLERLAQHVAELARWGSSIITTSELDFAKGYAPSPAFESAEELVEQYDSILAKALSDFESAPEEQFYENWSLRNGDTIFFTLPKHTVIRSMVLNHMVHHRAQLGVYLRMLDIPLPGMYGPSADDRM